MGEFGFGQDLVQALLREQHPDLAELELRDVAGGWDNQQWRLGAELAVRMPRTERAPALLRTEQKWLPVPAARGHGEPVLRQLRERGQATIARARGWAVLRALHLPWIGRNGRLGLPGGKPTWEPAGQATLERALAPN